MAAAEPKARAAVWWEYLTICPPLLKGRVHFVRCMHPRVSRVLPNHRLRRRKGAVKVLYTLGA
eukprot:4292985-Pyramimonas_sp.AAC.1